MAIPEKLKSMLNPDDIDVSVKQLTALSSCYGRIKENTLSVLMPLSQMDNFKDESFKVSFASLLKKEIGVERITYIPWSESAVVALGPSGYGFSQISRAVINNSNLFWDEGVVKLVCEADVFNLALGHGVKSEIKESVMALSSGEQPVLCIQCKK